MTDAENPEVRKADVEAILAQFDAKEDVLAALCAKTRLLIEAILQDANIRYHSIQHRVKNRKKLREKYLDPTKDYRCLDDVTDLAGLRVITYYEDDIDRVAEVIKREFNIDEKNSIDKRDTDPDRFSYSALNYVCTHLERRATDVEYKKFADICCEIQVTSILRHAWSEIEHEWYDLKEAYPKYVKRRFYRLAALLELAESEFLDLRKSKAQYERSVSVRVEANLDLPIDGVSIRSFVEQEPLVARIDEAVRNATGIARLEKDIFDIRMELHAKAANLAGLSTVQQLREALKKYEAVIPQFVGRARREVWPPPEPNLTLPRGVCIFQLCTLLRSLEGSEAVRKFTQAMGGHTAWDIEKQVALAKQVATEGQSR